MSDEITGFDYKGFYKRLCLCKLENKKICEMNKDEVVGLLNAANCFLPKKCVYCPNFTGDKPQSRSGICRLDGHKISDVFAFCTYARDVVPF